MFFEVLHTKFENGTEKYFSWKTSIDLFNGCIDKPFQNMWFKQSWLYQWELLYSPHFSMLIGVQWKILSNVMLQFRNHHSFLNINDHHCIIYNSKILERVQEWMTYGNLYNKLFHVIFKFQIIDKIGKSSQFNFNAKW